MSEKQNANGERRKKLRWVAEFNIVPGLVVAVIGLLISYGVRNETRNLTLNNILDSGWDALGDAPYSTYVTDYSQADLEKARRHLRNAQAIRSKDPRVLLLEASIATLEGDLLRAEQILRKALSSDPDDYALNFNLAVVLRKQAVVNRGTVTEAIIAARKASQIEPTKADPYFELGNIVSLFGKQVDLERALGIYEIGLTKNPSDAQIHYEMGLVLMNLDRPAEGRYSLAEAVRLEPDNTAFRMSLGLAYVSGGYSQHAAEQFQEVISQDPSGYSQAYYELAAISRQQGSIYRAERLLKEALRLDPNNYYVNEALQEIRRERGMESEAQEFGRAASEAKLADDRRSTRMQELLREVEQGS